MAYQSRYEANSFISVRDLSASGPIFMAIDSTGRADICGAAGKAFGILENAPLSTLPASVSYFGITKLTVAGNYAIGQALMSDATGCGVATDGTHTRAVMLEASDSTAYDIVTVRLVDNPVLD